jgi:hypothetical protein
VERTLELGRLDTERYLWRRAEVPASPLPDASPARLATELLRLFLSWSGPATRKDFAAWAGLTLREVRDAEAGLDLSTVAIEGHAEDALLPSGDVPALLEAPEPEGVRFLSFEDNLLTAHGGPAVHAALEDRARPVDAWGSAKPATLGSASHVSQRTILVRGRLAGYWELDDAARKVVTGLFRPLAPKEKAELARLAADTARFLLDEVGHGRSFSLDTDAEVRRRARSIDSI